eukprot:symbB.v1.2.024025.t2/scaffold2204.1/size85845/3
MTKLVESQAENIPVFTAVPKMMPYSMVYVQGMTGPGQMLWSAGDSSGSDGSWWTPSQPSMQPMPQTAVLPPGGTMPQMMQMPTPQLQQALQQQALQMQAMQQNAMQCGTNATMQAQQLQVPQMAPQMGQQMPGHMGPLQNPQMTMGPQTQLQLQQAPMQLPLQPLQQNQLAPESKETEHKDLPSRPDRRKIINQSLPSPAHVIVEEPTPPAVLPSEEVLDKAPGKQRRRRKELGKTESARFSALRGHLEHGGNEAHDAIAQIKGNVLHLAMESESSSRAVQMALKVATRQTATDLSLELSGHIAEAPVLWNGWQVLLASGYTYELTQKEIQRLVACSGLACHMVSRTRMGVALSLHGNHVLQRAIEVLPASKTHFIAEELNPRANEVARNVFGCRIFCRLLEQSATYDATQELIGKVLKDAEDLVQHQFGRFVAQAILEHGLDQQRHTLALALRNRGMNMAQHRNASHVIEKALIYCSAIDRRALAIELLKEANPEEDSGVATLARTQYGGFVVKALLNLGGDIEQEARRQLAQLSTSELKAASKETRFVERLLKELNYLPEDEKFAEQNRRPRVRRAER